MEIASVKRSTYWICFFILLMVLALFVVSAQLTVFLKVILVILLAFLSSMFRLRERYSFLSLLLVILAGLVVGVVFAVDLTQVWYLAFTYVLAFFLSCGVFERKLLGI